MPASLYPRNKRKKGKLVAATRQRTIPNPTEIKTYLLCAECEARFNRNGESEVLRWLAPKAAKDVFPLLARLQETTIIPIAVDLTARSGAALGIDTEKFAYFLLSLIWRASVNEWIFPDGSKSQRIDLGPYEEQIRQYLLEKSGFPHEAVVTITVCTDQFSREHWWTPTLSVDEDCLTFPVLVMGVVLRAWLGAAIPERIRRFCCRSSPERPIFVTHCDDQTQKVLGGLAPMS